MYFVTLAERYYIEKMSQDPFDTYAQALQNQHDAVLECIQNSSGTRSQLGLLCEVLCFALLKSVIQKPLGVKLTDPETDFCGGPDFKIYDRRPPSVDLLEIYVRMAENPKLPKRIEQKSPVQRICLSGNRHGLTNNKLAELLQTPERMQSVMFKEHVQTVTPFLLNLLGTALNPPTPPSFR